MVDGTHQLDKATAEPLIGTETRADLRPSLALRTSEMQLRIKYVQGRAAASAYQLEVCLRRLFRYREFVPERTNMLRKGTGGILDDGSFGRNVFKLRLRAGDTDCCYDFTLAVVHRSTYAPDTNLFFFVIDGIT